jgi:hypothetical protein
MGSYQGQTAGESAATDKLTKENVQKYFWGWKDKCA